ncbi:MAG: hypothetical protein NC201_02455 [Prevotella sp.]|nr:hypothetical protein [Prevotella sp.]MCM1436573.1 hypothetical protein [Prevotella sp.]
MSAKTESESLSYLKELALEADASCPEDCGDDVFLTRVSYDDLTREYVIIYTTMSSEMTADILSLALNSEEQADLLKELITDPETTELMEAIAATNSSFEYRYLTTADSGEFSIKFTPQQVKSGLAKYLSKTENGLSPTNVASSSDSNLYDIIDAEIAATNATLPYVMDDVTKLMKITRNGETVYYNYNVDEKKISFKDIKNAKESIRESLCMAFTSSDDSRGFIKNIADAKCFLVHNYHGDKTGANLTIIFTPKQLYEILNR